MQLLIVLYVVLSMAEELSLYSEIVKRWMYAIIRRWMVLINSHSVTIGWFHNEKSVIVIVDRFGCLYNVNGKLPRNGKNSFDQRILFRGHQFITSKIT